MTQPSGERVALRLHGGPAFNVLSDRNGHTVVRNSLGQYACQDLLPLDLSSAARTTLAARNTSTHPSCSVSSTLADHASHAHYTAASLSHS